MFDHIWTLCLKIVELRKYKFTSCAIVANLTYLKYYIFWLMALALPTSGDFETFTAKKRSLSCFPKISTCMEAKLV